MRDAVFVDHIHFLIMNIHCSDVLGRLIELTFAACLSEQHIKYHNLLRACRTARDNSALYTLTNNTTSSILLNAGLAQG